MTPLDVQQNQHQHDWAHAGIPEFCRIPQAERNAGWVGRPLTRTDRHVTEEAWKVRQAELQALRTEEDRRATEKRLTKLKGEPVTVKVKRTLSPEELAAERAKYDKK